MTGTCRHGHRQRHRPISPLRLGWPAALHRHFAERVGRLAQHKDRAPWYADIARVDATRYASREAALEAERAAIHRERPVHNKARPVPAFVAVELIEENSAKQAYRVAELAQLADRAVSTIEGAINAGMLSTVRVAGRELIMATSAREWLAGLAAMGDSASVTKIGPKTE